MLIINAMKNRLLLTLIGMALVPPFILAYYYPYPKVESRLDVFMTLLSMEIIGWFILLCLLVISFTIYDYLKEKR